MVGKINYQNVVNRAITLCNNYLNENGKNISRETLIQELSQKSGVAGGRTRVIVDMMEGTGMLVRKLGKRYAVGSLPSNNNEPVEVEKEVIKEVEVEVEKVVEVEVTKEIIINDRSTKRKRKVKEHVHNKFQHVVELADAGKNIMLYGPTGTGKTRLGSDVAKHMKRKFGFISCTMGMSEGQITGRLLPVGRGGAFEYVSTPFVDCYEGGGLFLLDEADAADANVMLQINSAISNGILSLPNRYKKPVATMHEDFVLIMACNTLGQGASRQYSGRNKLDAATLDRFAVGKVFVDYDRELEEKLVDECRHDYLKRCWKIRENIDNARLERAMSTRFILDSRDMMNKKGWTESDVFESYFMGWREDEKTKVMASI